MALLNKGKIMTDEMKRNKSAFPTSGYAEGMTLRDYFAAKAMAEIIARALREGDSVMPCDAEWAYDVADFMMDAREFKKPRDESWPGAVRQ